MTSLLVPSTAGQITPKLQASAEGAAGQCSGGGDVCGLQWFTSTYDGQTGVGEEVSVVPRCQRIAANERQMSALSVIGSTLIDSSMIPLSLRTGATSKSNPNAGTSSTKLPGQNTKPITTADKAGAAILTLMVCVGVIGGSWYLVVS